MAALRPIVLVYQEFASVSVTAAVPDLATLIAGPAYHLQDYPADTATNGGGNYGSDTAANGVGGGATGIPLTGADAIILADPPGNVVGALLESTSVEVHFEDALVEVVVGTGTFTATAPDENLFTGGGGETYATSGVRPGDRLVSTGVTGPLETTLHIVQEVGQYAGSTLAADELRMSSNYLADGTDIDGASYSTGDPAARTYRIEREIDTLQVSSSFVVVSGNQITIKGGITHLIDIDEDGSDEVLTVNYGESYVQYSTLRQDLALVNEIEDSGTIAANIGPIDERNPLSVGVFIALQNTVTPIKYYGITADNLNGGTDRLAAYTAMSDAIEARGDIYAVVPLANELSVITALQSSVEGLAAPETSNFRVVLGSSAGLPTSATISAASVTGATEEVAADSVNIFIDATADFATDDVRAADNLAILVDAAATDRTGTYAIGSLKYNADTLQTSVAIPGTIPQTGTASYYILRGTGLVEQSGVAVTLNNAAATLDMPNGTLVPADVGKVVRISGMATPANDLLSPVGNDDYLVTTVGADDSGVGGAGFQLITVELDAATFTTDAGPVLASVLTTHGFGDQVTVETRRAWRQILDTSATYVTDGVVVGDLVEVPVPPVDAGATFTTVYSAAVAAILSENRVQLALGSDIPAPDSYVGYDGIPNDLGYRIMRTLSKADQVTTLNSVVTSIASKRVVMVWPDSVDVAGVVNASTGIATAQPGYYLACAVGGMSAGLPPHQGFTNIGVAGIDEIHNSTRYFTEGQLESLSNAGWYLFVQETEVSVPYCLHQLTTDVSTLENGELSIVRDFDYISLFYKDILDDFLGRYNVIDQTLDLLREALNGGTAQLQSQRLPRIGAPIITATVDSIAPLAGQKDRVEVYMTVDLPFPLNRIGLHLVA
jgi:hypothetical protein